MPRNPKQKGKKGKKGKGPPPQIAKMATDGPEEGGTPAVWRAGVDPMADDETLDYDPTAYDCYHQWGVEWPCLSLDVLPDHLGGPRSAFPHTLFAVAGTQASSAKLNTITAMKVGNLGQGRHGRKKKKKNDSDSDSDSDAPSESESDDEDEKEGEAGPKFHHRSVSHQGGINRIRAMKGQPGIVASWSESGTVQVWDMTAALQELMNEKEPRMGKKNKPASTRPKFLHSCGMEGYGLDWSPQAVGRLATGDCRHKLNVWEPKEGGKWEVSGAYVGHEGSVEDIQWSPTEGNVLATGSVDKKIRIWDSRTRDRAMLTVTAHDADVNVLSWNTLTTYMLASGGDDGTLRVWDLRAFSDGGFVGHFKYHRGPVTSVAWSPHETSMLATSSEDHQIVVWDLALERDPEEEKALGAAENAELVEEVPAQVLFVHMGLPNPKELQWHTQIPGMIVATGATGFNAFKPENIFPLQDTGAA